LALDFLQNFIVLSEGDACAAFEDSCGEQIFSREGGNIKVGNFLELGLMKGRVDVDELLVTIS